MCGSGCGLLYKQGVPLEEVTCPCGHGYWDVFQERFVDGDQIRKGKAPPREKYEAKVKRELSTEEYTVKIRHQWIVHFLDCEIKRKLDKEAKQEGKNDGSTLIRAMTELWEMSQGDYRSRGTTHMPGTLMTFQHAARFDTPQVSARMEPDKLSTGLETQKMPEYMISSQAYRASRGSTEKEYTHPSSVGVPAMTYATSRTESRPRETLTSLDSEAISEAQSRAMQAAKLPKEHSDVKRPRAPKIFIKGEGIAWEILKHHQKEGTFGNWTSVERHEMVGISLPITEQKLWLTLARTA